MAPFRNRSIVVIDEDEDIMAVDNDLTILDRGMIHLSIAFYGHLFHQNHLSSH
jgi:hypothetical protein